MSHSVEKSWTAYRESTRYLAQGSSTSSKAPLIEDVEPAQIVRGQGCRVWDVDGNEYIDFRNALGPVSLGYAVPEVNRAITDQLDRGVIYGHPHPLEGEVAKLLVEVVPCAERVRFLKTGGEAIAACFKIARHATKRNKILQCGYNGWINTLSTGGYRPSGIAASEPCNGVPGPIAALHASMPWGDIGPWKEALENDDDIAAVSVASEYTEMDRGREFLPALRGLTGRHGVLMIMDEIVTGFRLALGGAQAYFGFVPDLAVFGKGMANGMPISAYLGRADLIDSARGLGISSTFGGEALSLAACKAAIGVYRQQNVIEHLWTTGERLWAALGERLARQGVDLTLAGYPVCPRFVGDAALMTRLLTACYRHGISLYNVPYVNFSHKDADVDEALVRFDKALEELTE
ncbi:MAG: aminotransferase class III-fold pyridoxal phosphate-dependent enzyme [bacterium]|nr:aminotransferase class III-fold pyridoxal phosphate-dependent enzyme [bacterium]